LESPIATVHYRMAGGIAAVAIGAPHFNFQLGHTCASGDPHRFAEALASNFSLCICNCKMKSTDLKSYEIILHTQNKVETKTAGNMNAVTPLKFSHSRLWVLATDSDIRVIKPEMRAIKLFPLLVLMTPQKYLAAANFESRRSQNLGFCGGAGHIVLHTRLNSLRIE
jgi:hypothetical protein